MKFSRLVWSAAVVCLFPVLSPAAERITNSIGMRLVLIPAGEFQMGADADPSDTLNVFPYASRKWLEGETPRHRVRITRAFYMGECETRLTDFVKFCHAAKYKIEAERDRLPSWGYSKGQLVESTSFRPWQPGWDQNKDHPVTYVTWNDAVAFCKWLSRKEGKTYRLPTEAEWEYACRAGTATPYWFGNDPRELVRIANVADRDAKNRLADSFITVFDKERRMTDTRVPFPYLSRRDGYAFTAPVGRFPPNAFGLYDMHGNVWEWCQDWYAEEYYADSPVDDPQGPREGTYRVLRGGGWNNTPVSVRSAARDVEGPSFRLHSIGFRVVLERE